MKELKRLHITECSDKGLRKALEALATHYPLAFDQTGEDDIDVVLEIDPQASQSMLALEGNRATIRYANSAQALRHIGALLSGCIEDKTEYCESTPLETIGIMLDCSRNAVMTVEHLQEWLRRLALMGYNMAMLYTEDTYEVDGEPYFGYQRGAYTLEELKAIDDYAASLGIEMIGCIQTLGHLEQILKWGAFREVKDTHSVLLVDEEKTYELIGKMLDVYVDSYRTRRIHVGMDETHDLGRGQFLDKYGFERGFDIFNRHLQRVTDMCKERGLEPMIWSDMYFRMGSKRHEYYDTEAEIPQDVVDAIPGETQLVYWDYYHDSPEEYEAMIAIHRDMNHEPLMGSGVWTWGSGNLWHDFNNTTRKAGACVEACRKSGLKEIFFTLWGDDGATCDIDSCLAGLAWTAEQCYAPDGDEMMFKKRFNGLNNSDFDAHRIAAGLQQPIMASNVLWDDPLLGQYLRNLRAKDPEILDQAAQHYKELETKLSAYTDEGGAGSFHYLTALLRALSHKCGLVEKLASAWEQKDKQALQSIVDELPNLLTKVETLRDLHCQRWYDVKKAQGIEVLQIRYAGQIARLEELKRRLELWLNGKIKTIEELDAETPGGFMPCNYHRVATASNIL